MFDVAFYKTPFLKDLPY